MYCCYTFNNYTHNLHNVKQNEGEQDDLGPSYRLLGIGGKHKDSQNGVKTVVFL